MFSSLSSVQGLFRKVRDGWQPILLQTAIALHTAGRLTEAEQAYRRILLVDPENADALHLLGVVAHQNGAHQEAINQTPQ